MFSRWSALPDYTAISPVFPVSRLYGLQRHKARLSRRAFISRNKQFLPNVTGVLADHGLSGLAAPGFLELRHVLDHAVHAVFPRRMRIGLGAQTGALIGLVLAPDLSPAQEHALVGSEAVNLFRLLALAGV